MSHQKSTTSAIKRSVLIMSGKGGVGKSTLASQIALQAALRGLKVGLLDVDICGPNLARMLSQERGEIVQTVNGWKPVKVNPELDLYLMSMAFLLNNKDSAVIWRGPKKHSMIAQFIDSVCWGPLDCLIVDTPPGTSDEHISLVEILKAKGIPIDAVLVTTPQIVACNDVRREISFCKKTDVNIAGLVENMCGYVCPNCQDCTNIFSRDGGKSLCQLTGIKFLGSVPIDPDLCRCTEEGEEFMRKFGNSETAKAIDLIVKQIII